MCAMSPRLLRPLTTTHPEAADWANRVQTNGGTVSGSTLNAVSRFCKSIDAAGIRDRFFRLNLFCGNSDASLNAVRTPLYRGPSSTGTQYGDAQDTNVNFVAANYTETGSASGGLQGDDVDQRGLDSTLTPDFAVFDSRHLAVYQIVRNSAASASSVMGSDNLSSSPRQLHSISFSGANSVQFYAGATANPANLGSYADGLMVCNNTSLSFREIVVNAVQVATNSSPVTPAGVATPSYGVFADKRGVLRAFSKARMGGYSIGLGFTAAQQHADYYAAMQAFQAALGRSA